jgi:hypothetical protein
MMEHCRVRTAHARPGSPIRHPRCKKICAARRLQVLCWSWLCFPGALNFYMWVAHTVHPSPIMNQGPLLCFVRVHGGHHRAAAMTPMPAQMTRAAPMRVGQRWVSLKIRTETRVAMTIPALVKVTTTAAEWVRIA